MIDLTKDQQNALDYIVENDWDVFILTGNAGTGKSTLLEIIQKSFKKNKFEIKKAKKVFSYSIFYLFFIFLILLIDNILK